MVSPLGIDFVQRRSPASMLGWTLLLVGLVGVALVALDVVQAREELRSAQERTERHARTAQTRTTQAQPRSATQGLTAAVATVNARVGASLVHPWGRLLKELEQLAEPGIALLAFEAQGASRQLRITAEARTMAEVVVYVESLRLSPVASSVVLGSHEVVTQDGVSVIRFSVDVGWGNAS
jgi:Fimbrial assembly protein (PilN)